VYCGDGNVLLLYYNVYCIPLPPTEGATLPGVGVMLESDNTGKIVHLEMSSYPEGKYKSMSDITVNCLWTMSPGPGPLQFRSLAVYFDLLNQVAKAREVLVPLLHHQTARWN